MLDVASLIYWLGAGALRVRLVALAFLLVLLACSRGGDALPELGIDVGETSVSGLSAGAYMAGQSGCALQANRGRRYCGRRTLRVRRKPSQQLPTLEEERSLLPFEDQFFVESHPSRLGTVYCVKVVGVLFRSDECPISRVFVASLR